MIYANHSVFKYLCAGCNVIPAGIMEINVRLNSAKSAAQYCDMQSFLKSLLPKRRGII